MNNSDANGFDITAESYQIIKNIGITVYLDNNNEKAILTLEKKLTNSIKLIIMLWRICRFESKKYIYK